MCVDIDSVSHTLIGGFGLLIIVRLTVVSNQFSHWFPLLHQYESNFKWHSL